MKVFAVLTTLIIIGNIARDCDVDHQKELALKVCGSSDNIAEINTSRFSCVNTHNLSTINEMR